MKQCINCGKQCNDESPPEFDSIMGMIRKEVKTHAEGSTPEDRGENIDYILCKQCAGE